MLEEVTGAPYEEDCSLTYFWIMCRLENAGILVSSELLQEE